MLEPLTSEVIKRRAQEMGFTLCGVAPVAPSRENDFFAEWLSQGFAGEMGYLERQKPPRLDPRLLMPDAQSVIVCAVNYNTAWPKTKFDRLRAWISRYAWGRDYHDTLKTKLKELAAWIETQYGAQTRAYVDTGPVNERVFARYAGIGWFGKNTCIINQAQGSWLFLGCILTNLHIDPDTPVPDRCGSCTRCLDACPTQAFVAPYVLDSRKCISYLTIELRGAIPEEHREGIGHHLFGCDICQDVCPWNRRAPDSDADVFQPKPGLFWPEIHNLLDLDTGEWQELVRHTPLKRAKIHGLLRNLMVVAGNSDVPGFSDKLARFREHSDEHVRSHAEWAIARLKAIRSNSNVPGGPADLAEPLLDKKPSGPYS